ncbi:MAG: ABC transporter permease [Chloroflexi bacterium]|nr:ABC transporter permease [Chloroflexota bacterium]
MTGATLELPAPAPAGPGIELRPTRVGLGDVVRIGFDGLAARKLRSVLTALGIAIGIGAMVAVLAVSESSRASLLSVLNRLGTNLLTVSPGQTFGGEAATLPEEATAMIDRIGPVSSVSGVEGLSTIVRRTDLISPNQTGGISVYAADLSLPETLELELSEGVFLNQATTSYPAVVLGASASARLGIGELDGNQLVYVGDTRFVVVGILEPAPLTPEVDRAAFIGRATAAELFEASGTSSTIYVRARPESIDDVRSVLGATANPGNPEEVEVSRPSEALEAQAAAAIAFTGLFLGLGSVALLVGGLGIANVMLMAVLERRAEIGLRRALGATRGHIAGQFLTEAALLAGLGGLLGVSIGVAIAAAYAGSQGWSLVVPLVALIGGPAGALAIGAVAGLYPALRASATPPTEALRAG